MATKEQRQKKQLVEKMLQIQGVDYDEWLDKIHDEYVQNNNKLIIEALNSKLNKPKVKEEKPEKQQINESGENHHQSLSQQY